MRFHLFFLASLASSVIHPAFGSEEIPINASFHAQWWSEKQMNGMNMVSPPPKETDVELKKWEYSDPVGVPHPDEVTVQAELGPSPQAYSAVKVSAEATWKVGPRSDSGQAQYERRLVALGSEGPFALSQKATKTVRFSPLKIKAERDRLYPKRWMWAVKVRILVTDESSHKVLSQNTIEMPIHPGD